MKTQIIWKAFCVCFIFGNLGVSAFASEAAPKPKINLAPQTVNTGIEGGSGADLLNSTKFDPGTPKQGVISITTGCTTAQGQNLKADDAGYEDCLRRAQKKPTNIRVHDGNNPAMGIQFGK